MFRQADLVDPAKSWQDLIYKADRMMFARLVFGTAVAAAVVVGTPPAHADPGDGIALNGTYTAFSDGVWAKTNDSYHDEAA